MTKLSITIVILPFLIASCISTKQNNSIIMSEKIHKKVLTIDTHTDTPLRFSNPNFDISKRNDPIDSNTKLDFPRMKEGGLDAAFFAVFIGQGDRNEEANSIVKDKALSIINSVHEIVSENSELAELAITAKDAYRIEKTGKRAIYLGMENGYPVGTDISNVSKYYDLGVRYITLCHTSNNDICDSSTDRSEHNGLSEFGKEVVTEMNELGMIVDVSHVSDKSFFDVIDITKTPVIASHSCARAMCDNPRNLDDDMLRKLAENGGVIQMCILSDYVKEIEQDSARVIAQKTLREKFANYKDLPPDQQMLAYNEWDKLNQLYPPKLATVSDAVDHIDHIVKVAGIDHVGIGTDFDGGGGLADCFDVSQLGNITIELIKRGYSEKDIEKIWGGNFMRVFQEVQNFANI